MCWENFSICGVNILENALNLGIFIHAPVTNSKLLAECFENLFPPAAERGEENNNPTNDSEKVMHITACNVKIITKSHQTMLTLLTLIFKFKFSIVK